MTDDFLTYALKVTLFHGICYLFFRTVLQKSDQFSLNRAYLIGTLILGFIVPLVKVPAKGLSGSPIIAEITISSGSFMEVSSHSATTFSKTGIENFYLLFGIFYAIGVLFLTARSLMTLRWIFRVKAEGIPDPSTTPTIIRTEQPMSFSFINTIVLENTAHPAVLLHEKGHVAGKHWMDLILLELVCMLCWMNPIVWLYQRSLREQHEYLADRYVLRHGISQEDYLDCIFQSLARHEPIGLLNKFSSQSLKQRIVMMTKHQSLLRTKLVYVGIVPLLALLFFSFSEKTFPESQVGITRVFVIDAAHGGSDAGSVSASGLSEKQISLELAKLVLEIGKEKRLNILLTRTTDQQLSLRERVDFATKAKADLFLSLHLGSKNDGTRKGTAMYVSEENKKFEESRRMAAVLSQELDDIPELGNLQVLSSTALVLKHERAASAILELGDLSNEQDAKFISQTMNQRKIAEKIVSALSKY